MSIGTIVSDASLTVKFWAKGGSGRSLGTIEEGFIARLRPGDNFLFGGRLLELVRVENMTAYVSRATGRKAAVPRWNGGRMPLSSELADAVVQQLGDASRGSFASPEMRLVEPLLRVQMDWSALPTEATLLAEVMKSREGWHLFLYPFAGRHVHLGLASLLAGSEVKILGEASNGDEALKLAKKLKPDVVLLDIRMPGKDGLATLEKLRAELPTARVVMLSTFDNPTYVARAVAAGAHDYILKGASRSEIIAAITGAAAGNERTNSVICAAASSRFVLKLGPASTVMSYLPAVRSNT
jgi:CheY-like chemotaxis protein